MPLLWERRERPFPMPKRIKITPHLSTDELEKRYRQATNAIERSHYQIIWLLAQERSTKEVAEVTGYSRDWIYELVRSYNQLGVGALGDLRRHNPGAAPKLDDLQQAQLLQALQELAPDGGLWNGRKVADYIHESFGLTLSRQQGWAYLKQMEFRLRVPRNEHHEVDLEVQEEWQKKLAQEVETVQTAHPDATVEIWAEDEHRIGMQPVMRRMWVGINDMPIAKVNWKREWSWLYAFVQPQTGDTYWWILPYVNTTVFQKVIDDFAAHFEAGPTQRMIVPLDRAKWHITDKLKVPEGIHLFPLPPYSPELQPAERLWPLVNEPLANKAFSSIQEVDETVFNRCRQLLEQKDLIRGLTFFHWWPEIQSA